MQTDFIMAIGSFNINILGDTRVQVPKSFHNASYESVCSDRPFYSHLKFLKMQTEKDDFKPSRHEVEYWRKIHDLNITRVEPKKKPVHIAEYLLQFVELMEAKG